jgi:predicted permease
LVFWGALPALRFRSVALAEKPGSQAFRLMLVLVAALGWLVAVLFKQSWVTVALCLTRKTSGRLTSDPVSQTS